MPWGRGSTRTKTYRDETHLCPGIVIHFLDALERPVRERFSVPTNQRYMHTFYNIMMQKKLIPLILAATTDNFSARLTPYCQLQKLTWHGCRAIWTWSAFLPCQPSHHRSHRNAQRDLAARPLHATKRQKRARISVCNQTTDIMADISILTQTTEIMSITCPTVEAILVLVVAYTFRRRYCFFSPAKTSKSNLRRSVGIHGH